MSRDRFDANAEALDGVDEASSLGDAGDASAQSTGTDPSAKTMRDAIRMTALGHAAWLMSRSGFHKHLFLSDIEWLLMPAIVLNQYRMWVVDSVPRGFATWAFLGADAEARLSAGVKRLAPVDWKSGAQAWLIDMVAPFGGEREMLKNLQEGPLAGKSLKSLKATGAGEVQCIDLPQIRRGENV